MNIVLNGEDCRLESARLDRALEELGYTAAHIATAVNGEMVPREARTEVELTEGDRLEVLAPLPGG